MQNKNHEQKFKTIIHSKLKPHSSWSSSAEAERVGSLPTLSPLTSWMSSLMESTSITESESSAESPHQILDVDSSSTETSKSRMESASSRHALRIVLSGHVVNSLSLRIFQQFISIDYFFEFLFGPGVLFVSIRMILLWSLLESLFNLLLCGVSRYAKYFVRIGTLALCFNEKSHESDHQKCQILDDFHPTCELYI